jgi:hypothetical protein
LAIAGCVSLSSSLVQADEPPKKVRVALVVRAVNRPEAEADFGTVSIADEAAQVAGFSLGIGVLSRSEMSETNLDDQLRDCGSDARCMSSRLREAGVDLGLMVVADLGLKPPIVTTRVIDSRTERVLVNAIADLAKDSLKNVVRGEVARALESAGHPIGGRVTIETSPPNALVAIDGGRGLEPGPTNSFILAPGRYDVRATEDGYVPTSTRARVVSGEETRIWLRLDASSGLLGSPWFWTAIVAALAAGGTALFFATRHVDQPRPLCQTRDPSACEH